MAFANRKKKFSWSRWKLFGGIIYWTSRRLSDSTQIDLTNIRCVGSFFLSFFSKEEKRNLPTKSTLKHPFAFERHNRDPRSNLRLHAVSLSRSLSFSKEFHLWACDVPLEDPVLIKARNWRYAILFVNLEKTQLLWIPRFQGKKSIWERGSLISPCVFVFFA